MRPVKILRTLTWIGLVGFLLGTVPVRAEPLVYVPLGGEGKIVVVDAATDEIINTMDGVPAVHGLAKPPDGQFLIAGSFDERKTRTSRRKNQPVGYQLKRALSKLPQNLRRRQQT